MSDPVVLQSAVRVPTPPPGAFSPTAASRKRSPPSRSPSPNRRRSPPGDSLIGDADVPRLDDERAIERERQLAERVREHEKLEAARKPLTEEEKQAAAKAEYEKLLNMRSGGTYIPPARLRALQAQITDKTSKEYQRMAWEALKKSINGLINKVNVSNIKYIVPELFGENLVRGRGLFCRSIMKAQAASLPFTAIYAAMTAIVNTKLPQVGELLVSRLIIQFRKAFKRNDKAVCISSTTFIAHLVNHQVANEMLVAQILLLLLHKPTDDSVEIAVGLTREAGQHLEEMNPQIANAVFDQFRNILHEADIDKRVQYMIEVLFQVRKDRYKDNAAIKEELDLVEEEDQITHQIGLDDEVESQDTLNIFKFDPEWEQNEEKYKKLKAEILGEDSDEDEGDEDEDESSEDESDTEEQKIDIKDQTNTDLVNLRRTIYLTIMSSIDFEECCHKLMKINLPAGLEPELPSMIIECCSQERTYSKFYGLIGERFAKINRLWSDLFEAAFAKYYDTIHRYETNRLRNIARFFGHMLSNDAIGWHVVSVVHMNEEETTSSSRIFIKILFQDLAENLGLPGLQVRFRDNVLRPSFEGLFPTENPRHTRFSINYFTSIGMGVLTEDMREHLKNVPRPTLPAPPARTSRSPSDRSYSRSSSYTGSSRSRSRSYSRSRSRSYSYSRSPSRVRGRSYSRSVTPSSRGRSYTPSRSRSPARRSRRDAPHSRSRSPSDRSRSRSRTVSRTPPRRIRARSSSRKHSRSPYRRSVSRSVAPPRPGPAAASRRDRSYSRSPSRSVSPPPREPVAKSATRYSSAPASPPPRRGRNQSVSLSRSRSSRRRDDSRGRSHSRTPPRRR
ncbi:Pre-mRNA-splicing factor cwc22 [Penicillium canariense]|uniref:Pre-mRNA-splicing factor CWC22 n=1 Tax=Penicillium canariense TaxID=189055 RepID=A0A9W9HV27_9EURO|nr:Pre-mRNA-splicing factor cwc22 [Penicillium canariense]KAJ5156954.1 Pre-mRNA-splicing factor cwc22 [Penicillium canariense]